MIELPEKCLRGLNNCEPLAQVSAEMIPNEVYSYICCGMNDGSNRAMPQDKFTLCWKNGDIDEYSHWDKRDLIDTISVIAQALSVDANRENN
jgi:hypothetical protein